MTMLRQTWAIVAKDLTAELHTREILSAMLVFALLSMLIFSFALDLHGGSGSAAAPGVLWTTITFAGTLGLNRTMAREQQTGGIAGLLLASSDRTAIFFGKALGSFIMMSIVEIVLLPVGTVLFDTNMIRPGLVLIMFLGTVGYGTMGTLLAAIAANTRAREVMLPILLLPLMIPLLIAAVQATSVVIQGLPLGDANSWLRILVVYDLVATAVAVLTFDYVIEA